MVSDRPQPVIEAKTRQGDIVIPGWDIGTRRFAVGSKSDEMTGAGAPIGTEIKEKGGVMPNVGIAYVTNLLIGFALAREDECFCPLQRVQYDWLCEVEC